MINVERADFPLVESESASEEEIVREILKNKVIDETFEHRENSTAYRLTYGKKDLIVTLLKTDNQVFTFVYNDRDESFAEDNETTLLYKAARSLMQEFANEQGSPIKYTFLSEFDSMKNWAESKGGQIFNWGDGYYSDPSKVGKIFEAEIMPDDSKLDKVA